MSVRKYSSAEVAQHNTAWDPWIIIDGKIYDLSDFIHKHPGGSDVIAEVAGKDATEKFERVGHSEDARYLMWNLLVGEISLASTTVHLNPARINSARKALAASTIPVLDDGHNLGIPALYRSPSTPKTDVDFTKFMKNLTASVTDIPMRQGRSETSSAPPVAVRPAAYSSSTASLTTTDRKESLPSSAGKIPIFLSFSKPVFPEQHDFIRNLSDGLRSMGMLPQTLGVTVYDIGVPLNAIKNTMNHSAGLICIAFRRTYIIEGMKLDDSDGRAERQEAIRDKWLTTPWPHIEVGMAFQIDLPILVLRESGVLADGILEKGSSAFYLPTFDLQQSTQPYLGSNEWRHIIHKWSLEVQAYSKTKRILPLHEELPQSWPWAHHSLPS